MKRIVFFIGCLFLASGLLFAQGESVTFNETTHDFGDILETGGSVSCEFILTNNTAEPLLITRVTASCGCTTPSWTREPIEPGKTGIVKALFNPRGRPNAFSKTITVYTNKSETYRLRIKGNVLREKVDPKAKYSQKMGTLLMREKKLDFGTVVSTTKPAIQLEVYNDSDAPRSLNLKNVPPYLKVLASPDPLPAKTPAFIRVELDASVAGYGNHNGSFTLYSDNVPYEFPYSALVMDDFSKMSAQEKEKAGKINLSDEEVDFGNLKSGNSRVVKFSNSGATDLHIKAIQSSDPLVKVSDKVLKIKPKEIKSIKISLDTKKAEPGFKASLTVISDDPKTPVKTISIKTTP
jgi:Protein of unknown function (DUF1573).